MSDNQTTKLPPVYVVTIDDVPPLLDRDYIIVGPESMRRMIERGDPRLTSTAKTFDREKHP